MMSSGSALSANAVKPRKSQNTTVMSRRWLSNSFSSDTTSLAICGDRKPLSRFIRSSSATWSLTRCSSVWFQVGEILRLRLNLVVQFLDAQHRAHAGNQGRLIDRLGQIFVGAGVEPGDHVLRGRARGAQYDRDERHRRILFQPPADLEAVELRHFHVEQDEIGNDAASRWPMPLRRRPPEAIRSRAFPSRVTRMSRLVSLSSTTRMRAGLLMRTGGVSRTRCSAQRCTADPGSLQTLRLRRSRFCSAPP